jgi:hypothetical protein
MAFGTAGKRGETFVCFIVIGLLVLIEYVFRCGVEIFIEGPYRKHNNNFGYVSEDERNTPQAFSHFTYEVSNHTVLICDIQVSNRSQQQIKVLILFKGVGDLYTDPQMHTIEVDDEPQKHAFRGKGNMGAMGMAKFLTTHQCNAICK